MATDRLQLAEEFMTGFVTEAFANGVPPDCLPKLLKRAHELSLSRQFPEEYAAGYTSMMKGAAGEARILNELVPGRAVDELGKLRGMVAGSRRSIPMRQSAHRPITGAVRGAGEAAGPLGYGAEAAPLARTMEEAAGPMGYGAEAAPLARALEGGAETAAPSVAQSARAGGSRWKWPVIGGLAGAGALGAAALGAGPGHSAVEDIRDWYENMVYGRDPVVGDLRQQLKQIYESRDPRLMAMAPTLLRHRMNQALGAYLAQFPGTVYKQGPTVPYWMATSPS